MNKLLFFIFVIVMLFLVAPKLKPERGYEKVRGGAVLTLPVPFRPIDDEEK